MSSNSLHQQAVQNFESTEELEDEDLVSSPEFLHLQAVQNPAKGKYLGRISQDHASALPQHYAPSLCRALRNDSSWTFVLVKVI